MIPGVANFYLISFAGCEGKNAADAADYLQSRNIHAEAGQPHPIPGMFCVLQ